MTQIILAILGVIIVAILITQKGRDKVVGICVSALDQTVRKSANKEKILTFLQERDEASNEEIREAFGFGRRSVVRYMTQLEKENKVEQVGDTGRSVTYRLK